MDSSPMAREVLKALQDICPVIADAAGRLAYARDLWPLGHIAVQTGSAEALAPRPWAVACPRGEDELVAVVKLARRAGLPVIPWGEGSGVCGGTLAVHGGIAVDLKRLNRIEDIDETSLTVTVQCGLNGQLLEDQLNQRGLTLGHSPSSILCSSVGGWLAARSAGQLSSYYGKIEDMAVSLRVVLPSGRLARTVAAPRAAMGPDWKQVFIGSEGTLGIISAATLRVHRLPEKRAFLAFSMPDLESSLDAVRETLQRGYRPAALRLYDPLDTFLVGAGKDHEPRLDDESPVGPEWPAALFSWSGLSELLGETLPHEADRLGKKSLLAHPAAVNAAVGSFTERCLLIMTYEGPAPVVDVMAAETGKLFAAIPEVKALGPEPAERWWRNRHAVSFKQSEVFRMGAFSDTMEVATTWDRLPRLYHKMRAAMSPHAVVLAHFSHAYHEGCSIYFSLAARCKSPEEAMQRYHAVWKAGLTAAVDQRAAISHHHGIGLLKADALKEALGPLHRSLVQLKAALDPENIMNPGKLGLPPFARDRGEE